MAAGPATRLADVIVPEIFTPYTQQLTEVKSRIIQSGVAARSGLLDGLLAGGGIRFNVPSFRDLDDDADRVSNDSSSVFNTADASANAAGSGTSPERAPDPFKIQTSQEVAVRLNRNASWSSMDLTAQLAGADPMEAIAGRVADYWVRRIQDIFIATMNGVIADNAASPNGADTHTQGDLINDVSGASFVDGVTNFTAEAVIDTALTMGDSMDDLSVMFVHSVVYSRMQKNNLIDFIPDSEGRVNIPTFLGREVIIDDRMPAAGGVYDTWLFGAGACSMGMGSEKVPTEVERRPGGGNGGGQEVLYNRLQLCLHPTGHAYIGAAAGGGPTNAVLDDAASWRRVYPQRKQIKFARLVTRES